MNKLCLRLTVINCHCHSLSSKLLGAKSDADQFKESLEWRRLDSFMPVYMAIKNFQPDKHKLGNSESKHWLILRKREDIYLNSFVDKMCRPPFILIGQCQHLSRACVEATNISFQK